MRSEFAKYGQRAKKEAEERRRAAQKKLRQQRRERDLRRKQELQMEQKRARMQEEKERLREERDAAEQLRAQQEYARTGGISFKVKLAACNGSKSFSRLALGLPSAFCGDGSAEGDRVLLPPSALTALTGKDDALKFGAMFFEVVHKDPISGSIRRTHVGVSSFSAPEGRIGITEKVALALGIDLEALARIVSGADELAVGGTELTVQFVRLPKATFVQFTPSSGHFVSATSEAWGGVKTVLEVALRQYATLTVGDTIHVEHRGIGYAMEVRALKPANAVSLIDTDVELDMTESRVAQKHAEAVAAHQANIRESLDTFSNALAHLESFIPPPSNDENDTTGASAAPDLESKLCDIRLRFPPVHTASGGNEPVPVGTRTWNVEKDTIGALFAFAFSQWAHAQLKKLADSPDEVGAGVIVALRHFLNFEADSEPASHDLKSFLKWDTMLLLRTHPRKEWKLGAGLDPLTSLHTCGFRGRAGGRPAREAVVFRFSSTASSEGSAPGGTLAGAINEAGVFAPEPVPLPKPEPVNPAALPRRRRVAVPDLEEAPSPGSPPATLPEGVEAFSEEDKAHKRALIRRLGDLCNVSDRTASFYLATNKWDPERAANACFSRHSADAPPEWAYPSWLRSTSSE
eukprot:INCI3813.1.p1 GENE.INCI3813.1~~INCI3813.1.p1  ORF type:complete len:633 (-),score=125.18 INCI3813.1:1497-3395(-)